MTVKKNAVPQYESNEILEVLIAYHAAQDAKARLMSGGTMPVQEALRLAKEALEAEERYASLAREVGERAHTRAKRAI